MVGPGTSRLLYVDWLRGLAVLCMFEAHAFTSWLRPAEMRTPTFAWMNIIAGYAAPLFLFLAGVGMAFALQGALARGVSLAVARRTAFKRGLQIFLGGLLFRVQEHVLGGGSVSNLFRVDILNCIGASLMLCAAVGWPRAAGRPATRALAAALLVALVSPLVARLPYSPRLWPLLAYLADGREWFFPLFPWSAYAFAGLFVGTVWGRGGERARARRVMLLTMAVGLALIAGSWLYLGRPAPKFLLFGGKWRCMPSYVFTHLGWICVLGLIGWVVQPLFLRRGRPLAGHRRAATFGPLRQLGTTSLLMYWVHVELVYGHLPGPWGLNLIGQLTLRQAAVGLALLALLMLVISWVRTRFFGAFRPSVVFERLWSEFAAYTREAYRKSVGPRPGPSIAAAPGEKATAE